MEILIVVIVSLLLLFGVIKRLSKPVPGNVQRVDTQGMTEAGQRERAQRYANADRDSYGLREFRDGPTVAEVREQERIASLGDTQALREARWEKENQEALARFDRHQEAIHERYEAAKANGTYKTWEESEAEKPGWQRGMEHAEYNAYLQQKYEEHPDLDPKYWETHQTPAETFQKSEEARLNKWGC